MTPSSPFAATILAATLLAFTTAEAATVPLQPIPDAFAKLGHSCGGIRQQIFGEGFDAAGNVTGYVFAITRCGGSGRGGGYHTTTYSIWVAVTWNRDGAVLDESTQSPDPDPGVAGPYHSGGLVGGDNYPSCDNDGDFDNAFSCLSKPAFDDAGDAFVQTTLSVVNQASCSAANTAYCSYRAALTTCEPACALCGDGDADGRITVADALAALRAAIGSGSCALSACDVDDSLDITAADAFAILENAVGVAFPMSCPAP